MPNINLADPELELIDPTPDVHSLFIHFDKEFFWTKLASRSVVRWSKRMYSCAGICRYDRAYCDIALSEPLLKLRPRKDLVETLLHEMIHAFLFITNRDIDRDGHGPNFKAHMHRINEAACLNISIYHDFHDEVKLYQTHWWRCNGPCVKTRPHFGIVRRSVNRPPGPYDYWWERHKNFCGGTFNKIKEPEKKVKTKASKGKKDSMTNPLADITKYITTKDQSNKPRCPKNDMSITITTGVKKNSSSTVVITPKDFNKINTLSTPSPAKLRSITVFSGTGLSISSTPNFSGKDAAETVRNIWANKQLPTVSSNITNNPKNKRKCVDVNKSNPGLNNSFENKRPAILSDIKSPPMKMKKIDDYFQRANSIIQELYGDNYELVKSDNSDKIIAINKDDTIKEENSLEFAFCPVCNSRVPKAEINKHLDECLNKDILEELSKSQEDESASTSKTLSSDDSKTNIHHINNMKVDLGNIVNYLIKKGDKDANLSKDSNETCDTTESPSEIVIKQEPGTSKDTVHRQKCACCGKLVAKSIEEHLDECLAFFDSNITIPEEGASTSIIVIDDDDDLDDYQIMNDTGTKFPCPSCLIMIEEADMNSHLDSCLS